MFFIVWLLLLVPVVFVRQLHIM